MLDGGIWWNVGLEPPDDLYQGARAVTELSPLKTTGLDVCGSRLNKAGVINRKRIQIQLVIAPPVSTQRVASDGDTGYPVGHFWRGISIHLARATIHIAPLAPQINAWMHCFCPLARKYNQAPSAKHSQAMNFHISSCRYSSNTRWITKTSPP